MSAAINFRKVIDPLFMDELRAELDRCGSDRKKLLTLRDKIANLKFFDPACGTGEFLNTVYVSLQQLETKILNRARSKDPSKLSVENFYGIDIDPKAVASTREKIPSTHIFESNALDLEWSDFLPDDLDYIIGRPPSIGYSQQTPEQKSEVSRIFIDEYDDPHPRVGKIDYVAAWFYKAAQFMVDRKTRAAFVASSSICKSEQSYLVWQPLIEQFKIHIDFARKNFRWLSDRPIGTSMFEYCVAVGFSHAPSDRPKLIFDGDQKTVASNINPYLIDGRNIFVTSEQVPLCNVPEIRRGNQPTDGGHLLFRREEYEDFVKREPRSKKYFRKYMMGRDLLNGDPRYCLWLVGATPEEIKTMPLVAERIEAVRKFRETSRFVKTNRLAKIPHLFREQITPEHFIAIPKISSIRRRYIPMVWLDSSTIAGDQLFMLEGAGLYEFGVLESCVHMAWVRAMSGRLGAGGGYSKTIIYNNFIWCEPTAAQHEAIERTAKGILDARAKYPDKSLAWMYNVRTMPKELREAHEANDRAVMDAYGFAEDMPEEEVVERLMQLYDNFTY